MVTPGWRAIFRVKGIEYEVRTDETASTIRLASGGGSPGSSDPLRNSAWRLLSFGPRGSESPVIEGSSITLRFGAEGGVGGSAGCNVYGGDYQVEVCRISFDNIFRTLMACTGEGIMQQESQYLGALDAADEFCLSGDRLTIAYGGQNNFNFERSSPLA